jgi:ribosome-interacting GTPase 1
VIYEGGVRNAMVKIYGKITLNQVVDALSPSIVYKRLILIGTKGDLPNTIDNYNYLRKRYSDKFPLIYGASAVKGEIDAEFGEQILSFLGKIRIYTANGGIIAEKPLILDEGVKVKEVAFRIHKSFLEQFEYAIVIRKTARQKRKKVGLDYKLLDNDIIEIHTA